MDIETTGKVSPQFEGHSRKGNTDTQEKGKETKSIEQVKTQGSISL